MATTTRKIDTATAHGVLGDVLPQVTRADNHRMQINGHRTQVFVPQTVTTSETNLNIPTTLHRVLFGMVFNVTDNVWLALPVLPLSTDCTVAVVTGTLAADKTFVVYVMGAN